MKNNFILNFFSSFSLQFFLFTISAHLTEYNPQIWVFWFSYPFNPNIEIKSKFSLSPELKNKPLFCEHAPWMPFWILFVCFCLFCFRELFSLWLKRLNCAISNIEHRIYTKKLFIPPPINQMKTIRSRSTVCAMIGAHNKPNNNNNNPLILPIAYLVMRKDYFVKDGVCMKDPPPHD